MSGHGATHGAPRQHEGRSLLQLLIVVALVVLLVYLHQWAGSASVGDLDPTAMLALGFVVLGSYTIGALFEGGEPAFPAPEWSGEEAQVIAALRSVPDDRRELVLPIITILAGVQRLTYAVEEPES